ncbi:A-kinase-interacting protein 1 isoform X3 [Columba livia]|uniref:A-kinase-interacting protein 1 isoform X3 n=1 Tax=Columba livia TaxID=8932 RepID=UPI0031B9CB25
MERVRAGRTAGLARAVLERARRRPAGARAGSGPEEDSEHLNAAFASIVNLMNEATKECEKYYSFVAASKCKEHEIKHICRYHGRQAGEKELESSKEVTRQASKDIYIEVSPGTYSVTATSEDMVEQTHVVDVNAGQSVDLTFVL